MARRFMPLFAAAAMTLLVAGTAGGKTTGKEHYSDTAEFTIDECDFPLEAVGTFSGQMLFREDKGGEAFLVRDTFKFRFVITNPETDGWFVNSGHGVFHEVSATHVEGNIYEFEAVEAGQPFVISDSDGNVIVRDRGVIRHTVLFDTLGDGQPGGELVEVKDSTIHGPHPAFADDFDFCGIAAELTGVNG